MLDMISHQPIEENIYTTNHWVQTPATYVSPNSAKVALIEPPSKENNGENIDAIRRNCAIISRSFISTPADTVCRTKILPLVPDYWGVEIGGRGLEQNLKRQKSQSL